MIKGFYFGQQKKNPSNHLNAAIMRIPIHIVANFCILLKLIHFTNNMYKFMEYGQNWNTKCAKHDRFVNAAELILIMDEI